MINIFVSYTQGDAECAERICQDLEALGYVVLREPTALNLETISYPKSIETLILGSAGLILVWSNNAARSERLERHILFAQTLKKPILPVMLDKTSLPSTLLTDTSITSQAPCIDVVPQLLPYLPAPYSTDPLFTLLERATHDFIRVRKETIDQAAEMLKRGEHREVVLAILEYLARSDLMMGVREKAQEVLDTDANKTGSLPSLRPEDLRHIFGVRCKNGHVTYFDKRRFCSGVDISGMSGADISGMMKGSNTPQSTDVELSAMKESNTTQSTGSGLSGMKKSGVIRAARVELDELHLICSECGIEMVARIDCSDYGRVASRVVR